jgi:hypothetical protein
VDIVDLTELLVAAMDAGAAPADGNASAAAD